MELTGERTFALGRARVWEALNDPVILQRCIPGCEQFKQDGENRYKVGVTASVGPIKARFSGRLSLSDIVPEQSYALSFEGTGGPAGFGKGNARVSLADLDEGGTLLTYSAEAQVGGRLAQVGARVIDGVVKKMADQFFTRFVREMSEQSVPVAAAAPDGAGAARVTQSASPAPMQRPAIGDDRGRESVAVLSAAVSVLAAAVAVLAAAISIYIAS